MLQAIALHPEYSFHSINIPSEWGSTLLTKTEISLHATSFHSINIPSEWGLSLDRSKKMNTLSLSVSIQLISPASGDIGIINEEGKGKGKFPFN